MAERVEQAPHAVERQVDPLGMQRQQPRDDGVVGASWNDQRATVIARQSRSSARAAGESALTPAQSAGARQAGAGSWRAARPLASPWSAAGRASASVARSSWRCTTMSTMPWSRRYSALLEAFRQLLADGLLDHARAGEADQRAGLGDVHVAQHRIGRGDAAGGRIGEHDDVGLAAPRAASAPRPWCAAAASARGCPPACARRRRPRT